MAAIKVVRKNRKPTPSQVEFAKKCQEIDIKNINWLIGTTCFSFFCYVFDIGLDIYFLNRYWNQKDYWYFGCTLAFVVLPIVVITIKSFLFYNNEFEKNNERDPRLYLPKEEHTTSNWLIKWGFGLVGFCLVQRYIDVIKYARKVKPFAKQTPKTDEPQNKDELDRQNNEDEQDELYPQKKKDQQNMEDEQDKKYMYFPAMIREDAELLQLSQFDSFMESAPQLLLNLYILLVKGESDFEVDKALGVIFSLVSLALAIVTYEKKIYLVKGIKHDEKDSILYDDAILMGFKQTYTKKVAILFFAHLFWIVARLIALSLFASVFGWIIWPACLAHLIPIFVWHRTKYYSFMDSLRLTFLHVFANLHPAENETDQMKHPRFSPVAYQSICICENLALMVMWSQSFIKFDEGINPGILSILYYPWNDWTFFVPWIGQILTFFFSWILFWWLDKVRKDNQQKLPTIDPAIQKQPDPALINPYRFSWC